MIREAKRPLTGGLATRNEEDVRLGRNPKGEPRVTVELFGANGSRTYDNPANLRRLGTEILEAAAWLAAAQQEGNR